MAEVITIGEPLVLFASTELNKPLRFSNNFDKYLAGAEVNFAIGAKRLGHDVEYLSQVGKDPLGDFAINEMEKNKIQTSFLKQISCATTGVEFKSLTNRGDPETFYIRRNSATANIKPNFVNHIDLSDIKLAHLTGIFPALSHSTLATTKHLIHILIEKEIPICFDPNLRPALWDNLNQMKSTINVLASTSTIFLPGLKEAQFLSELKNPKEIIDYYFQHNHRMKLMIIKDGSNGAYIKEKNGQINFIRSFRVNNIVDTVGAGDGFALGLVTALLEHKSVSDSVIRANAVGALAIQSKGDNTGYPTPKQLQDFLNANTAIEGE